MELSDRWLLAWGLGYVAVGGASLLVPVYALTIGGGAFVVGLLAATAAFAGVPAALLVGRFADRPDRHRNTVAGSLLAVAVSLAAVPLVNSTAGLLVINTLLWFAVAAAAPVCNLVIVAGQPAATWDDRLSTLNAVQGYGWVLGLAFGIGWLLVFPLESATAAQRTLALVFAAAAAIGSAGIWRVFDAAPSSPAAEGFVDRLDRVGHRDLGAGRTLRLNPPGAGRLVWSLRRLDQGDFRAVLAGPLGVFLLGTAAFAVGSATFWAPMPAYLDDQGMSTTLIFLLFLVANAGSALTYGRVADLEPRLGAQRLQLGGISSRGPLFLVTVLLGGVVGSLGGVLFLVGVTWAVVAVTAPLLMTRLVPANRRAATLATYTAVLSGGTGVGSVVGGAVAATAGYGVTFILAGGSVLLGAVLAWRGLATVRTGGDTTVEEPPHAE